MRRARWISRLGVLTLLWVAGCQRTDGMNESPIASAQAARARTVMPLRQAITRVSTQPASVHPFHEAQLAARVSGYVEHVEVDIGDTVVAGQVLAQLSVPELHASIHRMQAEIKLQRWQIKSAIAAELAAQAELSSRQSAAKRVTQLAESGAVTERAADEARTRLDAAQAALEDVKSRLGTAKASIDVARSSLSELETRLEFATLRAPFDGIVTDRRVDPGDLVGPHDLTPLFTVVQLSTVRLRLVLPERDVAFVDPGDPVTFVSDAIAGQTFSGTISRISRTLDPKTRSMAVEADLPNPQLHLMAGMFGMATVELEHDVEALTLPAEAVHAGKNEGESWVWVVTPERIIEERAIVTGLDRGAWLEVVSGLSGDEQVVTEAIGRLAPGATIELIETSED